MTDQTKFASPYRLQSVVRKQPRVREPYDSEARQCGGDVYNLTNSDAITAYNNNYIPDNPRRPKSRQTAD